MGIFDKDKCPWLVALSQKIYHPDTDFSILRQPPSLKPLWNYLRRIHPSSLKILDTKRYFIVVRRKIMWKPWRDSKHRWRGQSDGAIEVCSSSKGLLQETDINSRHSSHIVNNIKTKGNTVRSKGSCWEGVIKRELDEISRERYYYTLEKNCCKCMRREEKRINSVKKITSALWRMIFDEPTQN